MIDDTIISQIARYVAGESTTEEAEAVTAWAASDPSRLEFLESLRTVWLATGRESLERFEVDSAWHTVTGTIRDRARTPQHATPRLVANPIVKTRRTLLWRVGLAAAAAVLIAIGLKFGWKLVRPSATTVEVALQGHATRRGQTAQITLDDGTRVMLGVESQIRYPAKDFGTKARDVYLDGEAYFEVTHDAKHPFRVHTIHGTATDLGTKFDVRAYKSDTAATVAVAEGLVSLRSSANRIRDSLLLTPTDIGHVMANGELDAKHGADVATALAWTKGRIVFDDVPLRDALPQLTRWYDIDFVVADSALKARYLTASFGSEALSETLRLLASTLNVRYEQQGRTVRFFSPQTRR